jgi:membrane protein implicated in regulation of membrane protease activity
MDLWHWWVVFGIILFILELFTPSFVLACFGLAAMVTAIASFVGLDIKMQIVVFSVANIVIFAGLRPFFMKYLSSKREDTKTNVEALIGKTGIVTESIDPDTNSGRVNVGGEDWRALSDSGVVISKGQKIKVNKVDGTKLFVEPN